MSVEDAVIQVLKDAEEPLRVIEITERILKASLWTSRGKTPNSTVSACLSMNSKKDDKRSTFVKVYPQRFLLRSTSTKGTYSTKGIYSFLDAAKKVLDRFGNRNPMHYSDITEKALEQGWLNTRGKTPEATMNLGLSSDVKRGKSSGELGRFVRASAGYFGLVEWTKTGLEDQICKHKREIRKQLLFKLNALTPSQFEEIVGHLLAEMGFDKIDVSQDGSDGGIDVRGTLLIGGVFRIKMAVQVKHWKKNVHSPIVQQVRGSLGLHEQGLIVTTSDFSAGAIEEAKQPDKTPVGLMNGEQLVTLLMESSIGVRRVSHSLFELAELPITIQG